MYSVSFAWLLRPWSTWDTPQLFSFVLGTLLFVEILGSLALALARYFRSPLIARAAPVYARTTVDRACIIYNKIFTVCFNYALLRFACARPGATFHLVDCTLSNTVAATLFIFIANDFLYYFWHRFLHWTPMYILIHKIHHRELSPFRGTNDAFLAHPIEFMVTALFIPAGVLLCPFECHALAIAMCATFIATMSAFNHSRYAVRLGVMLNSRNHDTHHSRGAGGGNYAQFIWHLDVLLGTYYPWRD